MESRSRNGITLPEWNHAPGMESRSRNGITLPEWNHAPGMESCSRNGIMLPEWNHIQLSELRISAGTHWSDLLTFAKLHEQVLGPAMYERFTDRARKVMQLANEEAKRLDHEYIGTEHMLLGLVKEGYGLAAIVLKNLNIDLAKVRSS